jgi:glycosyltransferase involved in cell wall biosynthesis
VGITADAPLIGLVARYDPFKDHATFLNAAARVAREIPSARFVLCGAGVDRSNAGLAALIDSAGIGQRCHLLGPPRDVPRVLAALDVLASSSISEAFPLVLGEAMACGVPCAATDVGDSALIVGPTGRVVPPQDPAALGAALVWVGVLRVLLDTHPRAAVAVAEASPARATAANP